MLLKKLIQRGWMLIIFCQLLVPANAQQILTLERALDIAASNSPDIRRSLLNLERSEQSLKAQNAALKSNFSLNVTPLNYEKDRQYEVFNSKWYTRELTQSFGTFMVSQPFLPTDFLIGQAAFGKLGR